MATPSDKIFNNVYKCKIPYGASCDQYVEELLGPRTEDIDSFTTKKRDYEEMIVAYCTIEKMATYYGEGFPVVLLEHESLLEIYEIIEEHLAAFNRYKNSQVNDVRIPKDDLILLDKFAQSIYDNNKAALYDANMNSQRYLTGFKKADVYKSFKDINVETGKVDLDKMERKSKIEKDNDSVDLMSILNDLGE